MNEKMQSLLRIKDQAINGKNYSKDPYDIERYEEIIDNVSSVLAEISDIPKYELYDDFLKTKGYVTPKLGTRAAIFNDEGKILLTQEKIDGLWTLPGGWVDNSETVYSNTIKEVKEEAGLDVLPKKIVAIFDSKTTDPLTIQSITKIFVECELLGGAFVPNTETLASGYFRLDELPPLSEKRANYQQIELCFKARKAEIWNPVFE